MKVPKLQIRWLSVVFPIMMICISLIASGKVSIVMDSFALDSTGNLYVGKLLKIEVYRNDSLLRAISPVPRAYCFTIQQDDSILLTDGSTIYMMDLYGKVLSQSEDQYSKEFNKLNNKRTFISKSGEKYLKRSNLGRIEIVHLVGDTENVIYRMPVLDYIVLILFWGVITSGFIIAPISLMQWKKMKKELFSRDL